MRLRQVQARPLQGHRLRALRRRGHQVLGSPRAHGPHRARRARHPHLVLQGRPVAPRVPPRHGAEGPREGHLLRRVHGDLGRRGGAPPRPPDPRGQPAPRDQERRRPPRRPRRDASGEAGGGARGPGGRGCQGRPEEEGQGCRREGDGIHPQERRRPGRQARADVGRVPGPLRRPAQAGGRRLPGAAGPLRPVLRGLHGRRVDPASPPGVRPAGRGREPAPADLRGQGPAQDPCDQAPEGRQLVPADRHVPGIHGPRRRPGDPAGAAPDGPARRWPFRDERPERPVPPSDQPQQPPPSPDRPRCPRDHRQQREAHAAGGRRRPVRQRPPRSPRHGYRQPCSEVPQRHAEGQAGSLPPEPARQARGLLGPFGHHRRPAAEAAPVRSAQADGARALQAVRDQAPDRPGSRPEHQGGQASGRAHARASLGRARGDHPRAPRAAQPRAYAPPPRHPGVRAAARRGQGHPAAPARLRGVQRRLRR